MIKNIVFDMGGVLIDYNPEKTLYGLVSKESADIALKEIFRNPIWGEKDRGVVFPDDIWEMKGSLIPDDAVETVKSMTYNLYPYMKPLPEMYDFVNSLRSKGYGIYLLSNASLDFYENKINIPALSIFDGYLISADYLLLKPEKAIYEKLYTKFGLDPAECVFIDDVPANVQGSIDAGMDAVCFSHRNLEILKNDLRAKGVRI